MKRFLIALIIFLLIPSTAFGAEFDSETYEDVLSSYDLSFFKDKLDKDTYDILEELNIDGFSFQNIYNLQFADILNLLIKAFKNSLLNPVKTVTELLLLIIVSALLRTLKSDGGEMNELYSTVTALLISVFLIAKIGPVISVSAASLKISSNFIYAFVPVFSAIVAASGGITQSFSTNTMLLLLSQGLSFLSSSVIMPVINSFLAVGLCSALRPQLGLSRLATIGKNIFSSLMAFISASYVSVLSIKTAVSAKTDMLGIRSVRFVISSVVPVIGGALSEGLISIQTYSSMIKSSVGIVGIIAVALVFLPSLSELIALRLLLSLSSIISDVFYDEAVSKVLEVFNSALLIITVLLIMAALTTVVSIGILISAGN